MVHKRNRFFLYFFALNLIILFLYIIFLPPLLRNLIKKNIRNSSINFSTVNINLFKGVEFSDFAYKSKKLEFTAEYVKIEINALNLLLKHYKINHLIISNGKLVLFKYKSNKLAHYSYSINNFNLKNIDIILPDGMISNVYATGVYKSKKNYFQINNISFIANINKILNNLEVKSGKIKGNITTGISLKKGSFILTPRSKIFLDGEIKKHEILLLHSRNLDLNELNKTILFGKNNEFKGLAKGKLSFFINGRKTLIKGYFRSDNAKILNLPFKKLFIEIKKIFDKKIINLPHINGDLWGSSFIGNGEYILHRKILNIYGNFKHFDLSSLIGGKIKIPNSLNFNANITLNGISKKLDIDIKNVSGNIYKYTMKNNSNLNLLIDIAKKGDILINNGLIYSKNGSILQFDLNGNINKKNYHFYLKKIDISNNKLYNLYSTGFINIKGGNYDGKIYPQYIEFNSKILPKIVFKGSIDIKKDNIYGRLNGNIGSIKFLKNEYYLQSPKFTIIGGIKNNLKLHIRFNNKSIIDVIYDNNIKISANGNLTLINKYNGQKIALNYTANYKNDNQNININLDKIFIHNNLLLSKEGIKINRNKRIIKINLFGNSINGLVELRKKFINGHLKLNSIDLNTLLTFFNNKKSKFFGQISTKLDIKNSLDNPIVTGNISVKEFAKMDKFIGFIEGNVKYENNQLFLNNINIYHKLYYIKTNGFFPIKFSIFPFETRILDKDFRIDMNFSEVSPDIISFLYSDIPYILYNKKIRQFPFRGKKGTFQGEIIFSKKDDTPEIDSKLILKHISGKILIDKFNYWVENANGNIIFVYSPNGYKLNVDNLNFKLGLEKQLASFQMYGTLKISDENNGGELNLQLNNGSLPLESDNFITHINKLKVKLFFDDQLPKIDGFINISNSKVKTAVFNIIDFVVNSIQKKKKTNIFVNKKLGIFQDHLFDVNLMVNSITPIYFTGTGQNFYLSFKNLNIKGPNNDLKIAGIVNIPGGDIYKFGNTFTFLPSTLEFNYEKEIDPNVNIKLQSFIHGYQVNIQLNGKAKNPNVHISSIPQLSILQIVSLIVFKDINVKSMKNSIYSLGINLLLSDLMGNFLKITEKTSLGFLLSNLIDSMKIERIEMNEKGELLNKWRFSIGKYIFPELYVGYSRYSDIKYDQLLEFKFFINPNLILSMDLSISPYENRTFGDSIYIIMVREFDFSSLFRLRK